MMRHGKRLATVLLLAMGATAAKAGPAEDFNKAFATATAHEKEAAANKNRWPATEDALKEAKKAADAQDFARALALARQADALAQASLYQSRSEATAWKDAVIK